MDAHQFITDCMQQSLVLHYGNDYFPGINPEAQELPKHVSALWAECDQMLEWMEDRIEFWVPFLGGCFGPVRLSAARYLACFTMTSPIHRCGKVDLSRHFPVIPTGRYDQSLKNQAKVVVDMIRSTKEKLEHDGHEYDKGIGYLFWLGLATSELLRIASTMDTLALVDGWDDFSLP
jgi:hypothetical protein